MTSQRRYEKKCVVCNAPFTAFNNKALYCKTKGRNCAYVGVQSKKLADKTLGLRQGMEDSLIMRNIYFMNQVLAKVIGYRIPQDLIPQKHVLSFRQMGYELSRIMKIEERKLGDNFEIADRKIKSKVSKEGKPKQKNIMTEQIKKQEQEDAIPKRDYKVNLTSLKQEVKTLITNTLKKNTGKFPILPPQINSKIDIIISTVIKKIEGDINNKVVLDYIEDKIKDIKTMIDADFF